jgi:predicted O-linked N-acetylglucosamine transferase (SPINDLY family)
MQTVLLEQAIQKHRQGQLVEAGTLYQQVLQQQPGNIDALYLMSTLANQLGDLQSAVQLATQAISLKPNKAELYIHLGNLMMGAQDIDPAIEHYRKAIHIDRRNINAMLALGDAFQEKKDYSSAIEQYQRVLKLDRSVPEAYNNWGNALYALERYDEALSQYQKAISLRPRYVDATYNLGNAYRLLGQLENALNSYLQALEYDAGFYKAHTMLGVVLRALGKLQEANTYYQQALALIPPNTIEAAITLYNQGNLYQELQQFDPAIECFQQSLRIQPGNPLVLSNLAGALAEQCRTEEAIQIYTTLAQQSQDATIYRLNSALQLPVLYQSAADIDQWRNRYEAQAQQLLHSDLKPLDETTLNGLSATSFYLSYQGKADRALQEHVSEVFKRILPNAADTATIFSTQKTTSKKPKIGFISRYFRRNHTIGKFMEGLIKELSRDRFDVVIFSIGTETSLQKTQLGQASDTVHELSHLNLAQARHSILSEKLDILFYSDIGMDPFTYLLAQHRLAPVQCVTWGHPTTTGSSTIDYFISSRLIEPEKAETHYTEQLVLLDTLPTYYYHPKTVERLQPNRPAFGLKDTDHVYLCPQSLFKFHPDFDPLLKGILEQDPNGVLVLISHYSNAVNQMLLQRFQTSMPNVINRIRLLPRMNQEPFLQLLACADVMLDPLHFGGGNTTYEALALGLPIITWPGKFMRSRVTSGCYHKMNLTDCIVDSAENYVRLAVELGTNAAKRQQIHEQILTAKPVLFEDKSVIHELEQFFLTTLGKGDSHA